MPSALRRRFISCVENRRHVAGWSVLLALSVGMCAQTVAGGAGEPAAAAAATAAAAGPSTLASTTTTTVATTDPGPQCPTDFCVLYTLRPSLTWSDGSALGAADFERTVEVMTEPITGRPQGSGYERVVSVSDTDDGGVLVALDGPYERWESLFDVLLPRSWSASEPLAGPFAGWFVPAESAPGDYLVVTRREGAGEVDPLSGDPVGDAKEITFLYKATPGDALEAFRTGEVDVVAARATSALLETSIALDDGVVALSPGPFWEQVTFNMSDPLLSQDWVRRSIAMTIDRGSAVAAALGSLTASASPLDNSLVLPADPSSEAHYDVAYDPAVAEQTLVDHGCERGDDDVYVCDGSRMSFSWVTSAGDPDREALASQVAAALANIGVELRPTFLTPSQLLTPEVLYGDATTWQIINFSWNGATDPSLAASMYECVGDAPNGYGRRNAGRYCSELVQVLIDEARSTVSPAERKAAYNAIDDAALADLPLVPLYQKPVMLVTRSSLHGPMPSLGRSTDLWNVVSWKGMDRLTVAVDAEPDVVDPVSGTDGSPAMALSVLYPGALGVTPDLGYGPLLVDSVTVIGAP